MTFMHFDATQAASAVPVITLSGSLGAPNTVWAIDGTNDGNEVGTATGAWIVGATTVPGIPKGSMVKVDTDFGGAPFYSVPKQAEWNSDKDFTGVFWVRARHDPNTTGDPLWGVIPTSGFGLDIWYALIGTGSGSNPGWTWSCSSKFSCLTEGTVEVSIARNITDVITSDHTSLAFDTFTITRSGGTSFLTQGFAIDQLCRVTNSENGGENDTVFARLTNVTSTQLTTNVFWTTNAFDTTAVFEKYGEVGTIVETGYYKARAQVET